MPRNELHGLALATLSLQHDVCYIIIIYNTIYHIIHSSMYTFMYACAVWSICGHMYVCMYVYIYIYIYVACFSVKNWRDQIQCIYIWLCICICMIICICNYIIVIIYIYISLKSILAALLLILHVSSLKIPHGSTIARTRKLSPWAAWHPEIMGCSPEKRWRTKRAQLRFTSSTESI